jgi:hypothetical protein
LAEGFLNHPANDALRTRLQSTLTPQDLYHELLRLVYRILFLLVAEARGLIGGEEAPPVSALLQREPAAPPH